MHERFLTVLMFSQDQGYQTVTGQINGSQFTGTISELIWLLGTKMYYNLANVMVYRWLRSGTSAIIEGDGINLTISK